jgi:N-acetylneuraminic acid mutarotase
VSLAALASTHGAGWEELPPSPVPNGGGICGAVGTRIVMIGGTHWEGGSKNWLRSVFQYDPERRVWTRCEDLLEPIAYGADFEMAGGFGFLGGSDGVKAVKAVVMMTGEKLVTQSIAALPSSIVLSAGGAIGNKYVIVGGTDDAANIAGVQRTTHVVESVRGEWKVTRQADFPGHPFAIAASAVIDGELFVFGGAHWDAASGTVVNTADAFAFSPATNQWRALKPLPAATRGISAVTLDAHRLYLAGGFTEVFSADAWIYDQAANRYDPATPLPIAGMVSLVRSGDHLYSIAGEDRMKSRTDRCFRIPVAALNQASQP